MKIYPAIDIKSGRAVRLRQGKFDKMTVFFDDPVEAAQNWVDKGASVIHIVDLDGAQNGRWFNESVIKKIVENLLNLYYNP